MNQTTPSRCSSAANSSLGSSTKAECENTPSSQGAAHVPNKIPFGELFSAFVLIPLCLWLSIMFLADGKAIISFSKRATHHIEVSGPWSSLLGAIAMLLFAAMFSSIVFDHFDRRPNEHHYSRFAKWVARLALAALVLACLVGWQFEHIRWVKR